MILIFLVNLFNCKSDWNADRRMKQKPLLEQNPIGVLNIYLRLIHVTSLPHVSGMSVKNGAVVLCLCSKIRTKTRWKKGQEFGVLPSEYKNLFLGGENNSGENTFVLLYHSTLQNYWNQKSLKVYMFSLFPLILYASLISFYIKLLSV